MALPIFSTFLLLMITCVALRIAYQIAYYRFFHPLSEFPGTFWGTVTRLWLAYHNLKQDECAAVQELHQTHGPIIRATPTLLLINDPTQLPVIYNREADKSRHYMPGVFGKDESVFNILDAESHKKYRKLIARPYSFSNIKKIEPSIDAIISKWTTQLETRFTTTQPGHRIEFDFAPWAVYMAYDAISEIGFGSPFGFIDQGKDVAGLIQGFHDGMPYFGAMARLWPFTMWIKDTFLGKFLVASPEHESGVGVLMRFRDRIIEDQIRENSSGITTKKSSLLQAFMDAKDKKGQPLDIDHIKAEALLVLGGGSDTTGTAFQALVLHLLSNKTVYEKMMNEIDRATREGKLSWPIPQYSEVSAHCPYYVACVKESMRITPSGPTISPRIVPKGGLEICGRFVPEGTEVSCNPWHLHRDETVFGPNAESFSPERWLNDEQAKRYQKFHFGFGYGGRTCLGKDIAYMELFKAPLQFFRSFDIELANNKQNPPKYLVKGGVCYFEDIRIVIKKRSIS